MMKCKLDNITVHYETCGSGRPLLMLHAGYHDHRHVLKDLEPLFERRHGWKRFYPDLPGHGRTSAPDEIRDQDQVLDVILKFVDKVIPGHRFALGGVSRGAYLARGIVYSRPESVDGLLLVVPAVGAAPRSFVPEHVALVKDIAALADLNPKETKFVEERVVVQTRKVIDRLRSDSFPAHEMVDKRFQVRILSNYEFSFAVDRLSEPFARPALILLGRQDCDVGYHDAWELLEDFPRATFAVLDMAGHFLSLEQDKLFRFLVDDWLDRVEAESF